MISTIITRDKKPAKAVIPENEPMANDTALILKAGENEPELQANAEPLTQDEIDKAIPNSAETDLSSEDLTNEPSQDTDLGEETQAEKELEDSQEDHPQQTEKEQKESQEDQPQQKVEEQPQQAKAKKSKKS